MSASSRIKKKAHFYTHNVTVASVARHPVESRGWGMLVFKGPLVDVLRLLVKFFFWKKKKGRLL